MRIIFVSASGFGVGCLEAVRSVPGMEICGIITNRKLFTISYSPGGVHNSTYFDFSDYGAKEGIPVYVMESKMTEPELLSTVRTWRSDWLIVAGWYHMIPRSLRDITPALGLHASLLPDYAGGAPLVWAIINGEKKTGVTLFRMADGVDDGDILGQREIPILPEDTISTLRDRAERAGAELLRLHLPELRDGRACFRPQNLCGTRRIMPQRSPADGRIQWSQSTRRLHDFIRAQTRPYPGAFAFLNGKKVIVWTSKPFEDSTARYARRNTTPGEILDILEDEGVTGILVAAGDGPLLLTELEIPGSTDLSARKGDWHPGQLFD